MELTHGAPAMTIRLASSNPYSRIAEGGILIASPDSRETSSPSTVMRPDPFQEVDFLLLLVRVVVFHPRPLLIAINDGEPELFAVQLAPSGPF